MTNPPAEARSGELFKIAEQCGIHLMLGSHGPANDDQFRTFCEQYVAWSKKRDLHLNQYLEDSQQTFRTYLPFHRSVLRVVAETIWYYDEFVLKDPLAEFAIQNTHELEKKKLQVLEALDVLTYFQDPIERGLILLRTEQRDIDRLVSPPPELAYDLATLPQVNQALRSATRCGYAMVEDRSGTPRPIAQLRLRSGGLYHATVGNSLLRIHFDRDLPEITKEELARLLDGDPFEHMADVFAREVNRTLRATQTASELNAAVLFDREVDGIIVSQAGNTYIPANQTAAVSVLNLTLPFVRGISPAKLCDLRERLPDAFYDFRAEMVSIVEEGIKDGVDAVHSLESKVERAVRPKIRHLEGEISGALKKAAVFGIGTPLVATAGVLAGTVLSVSKDVLFPVAVGGGASAIKAIADFSASRSTAATHPFYFLWKAKR